MTRIPLVSRDLYFVLLSLNSARQKICMLNTTHCAIDRLQAQLASYLSCLIQFGFVHCIPNLSHSSRMPKAMANDEDLIPLTELDPVDQIYQGCDSDGGLQLQSQLAIRAHSREPIPPEQLVALALTEVCCTLGQGKVSHPGRRS